MVRKTYPNMHSFVSESIAPDLGFFDFRGLNNKVVEKVIAYVFREVRDDEVYEGAVLKFRDWDFQ